MSKSLLSKKSTLTSRRNIIIYIVATILILGIVAGFTNVFHTDNRRFAASWGETIVIETQPPASGSPSDYDLLSNLKFTAYKLHHSKYFKGYTEGKVSADIGIGNYTQYLTNTRVVYNENIVFTETISSSSMKSLAEQKYADNGIIIYRAADKISGNKASFSSKAAQMSYDDYSEKYGTVPNQLSKYIINEKTILSVKDENAPKAAKLNGDGNGEVSFDVPDKLVPNADGNYVFTLTLDPTASSLYYRNEVRTLGGADQNPKFYSVKITITVNSEWIPVSTRTLEEYDIEIPVLGAMRCNGDNLETFSMIDDENGTIPEKDFFQPYVDQAKANPDYKPPAIVPSGPVSPSDYLAAAFQGYLSGEQNLDLTADININGIPVMGKLSAYDLTLSVNLDTLAIQAKLGDGLYVKYADDKVYIKNNDINGYISAKDAAKLMDDPVLKGLLTFGELDMNKIFGGDMLDVIFRDSEMTEKDGVTDIPMSFALDLSDVIPSLDKVRIAASIKINSENKSLNSITGTVTIGDVTVDIEATPLSAPPSFPSTNGAKDLSGMLDFIPDIAATAVQTTYGIDGTFTLNDMTFGLSAYIDRTKGMAAEVTLNVAGIDVLVKYIDGVVYVSALGVNVRGAADELSVLLDALLDMTDFAKYQKLLKAMLPTTLNQIVDMLDTITVDGNSLDIGLDFLNMPIDVKLTRGDGKLQSLALGVNVDMFGIQADISADLRFSEPTKREVTAPTSTDALTFADVAALIKGIKPYLDADYYTADVDGYVEVNGNRNDVNGNFAIDRITDKNKNTIGIAASGALSALGQNITVTYADGTAYVSIGNIKAKLDVADTDEIISSVMRLVGLVTGSDVTELNLDLSALDGAIKATATDGTLNIMLSTASSDVTVSLNLKSGNINITVTANGVKAELNIAVSVAQKSHGITAPTDADKYLNAAELTNMATAAARIAEAGGITVPVSATCDGKTYSMLIEANFDDGMSARITENTLGMNIVLAGDALYIGLGEIRLYGTLDQAKRLYSLVSERYDIPPVDRLLELLPQTDVADIQDMIAAALDSIVSLTSQNGMISAEIAVNGFAAAVELKSDLSEITLNITSGKNTVSASVTPTAGCKQISAPSGEYVAVSEFETILTTALNLAENTTFDVAFDVSTSYGDGYTVDGSAVVDISDGIKAKAAINALGQTVEVTYIDDIIYFGLQALRFKLNSEQLADMAPSAQALLAALGITLPDIGATVDGLKAGITAEAVENALATGISCVKSFNIRNGIIILQAAYADYALSLEADCTSQNGMRVTLRATALNAEFGLNVTLGASEQTVTAPEQAKSYSDVAALTPLLDSAANIIAQGGVHTVVSVSVMGMTLNAAVDCTIEDGMIKAVVTESTLGLNITLLGDTAYISVGGIKVSGQLKDVTRLMDAVLPNLPEIIKPYMLAMSDQMKDIVPSQDELTTNGKSDLAKTLDTVLAMLTELAVNDDNITLGLSRNALTATLNISTSLDCVSGNVALTMKNIGGPFGDCYSINVGLNVGKISAAAPVIPTVNTAEYVSASTAISAIECLLPLAKENAFDIGISATVFGQTVTGNVYIDLGEYTLDTIAVKARLMIAGTSVTLTLKEKTIFLDINDGSIRLAQPLGKDAITELLAQIDEALPELKLSDALLSLFDSTDTKVEISDILNNISLSPTKNGMAIAATFGKITVNANIAMTNGALGAISLDCDIDGKQVAIAFNVKTSDDVLCGIQTTRATVMGVDLDFGLTLSPANGGREITPDGDYIAVSEFIPYIAPVKALMERALSTDVVTVDLSDAVIEVMGKQISVSGKIDMSFKPVNVRAVLTLFADSETDKIDLTIVYVNNVLYISVGEIRLKFDIDNDMSKLNSAIEPYLPKSLKSLGDLGALSPIFTIVNNIGKITSATATKNITAVMGVLFDDNNAFGKSTVRLAADMIRLFKRGTDGEIAVGINVMEEPLDVTLNVQPKIDNGYLDFGLGMAISNLLSLNLTAKLTFSNNGFTASAPSDGNYTPIVDFVTTVINAVNTLTAKAPDKETTDGEGNTTTVSQTAFEIESFAFDYEIFRTLTTVDKDGNVVTAKDDAGRAQIAKDDAGNKITEKKITVSNIDGQKALRFGLTSTKVKDVNGKQISSSTKLAVEAHIKLGIQELKETVDKNGNVTKRELVNKTGFPIELDLYVQPLDTDDKGLAYLYYREANGHGEKISIDYKSVLEIVSAVLDILDVHDPSIDKLLKDYKLSIDTSVFEYMSIAGLDDVKGLLNDLLKAVGQAKDALSDAKAAWSRIQAAEDLDALIYEAVNDTAKDGQTATAKALLDSAISRIKSAIALFKTDDGKADAESGTAPADNNGGGALVGKIVNSVYFNSADSVLSAYVNNSVATGTDGWAVVSVTSGGDKINDIGVSNLDVNTAKLNKFDMKFAPITDIITVTVPNDYTTEDNTDGSYKVMHSDFGNIKHLLFDVMNTANMLEFDIGGLETSDAISVHMKLGADWLANIALNIKYNAKVKIIKDGEDENGKDIYKTAAAIEIHNEKAQLEILGIGSTIIIPDCTTRLFFYDDVIYVQGVRDWGSQKKVSVGNVDINYTGTRQNGKWAWNREQINENFTVDYPMNTDSYFDRVEVMYTVDELFYMMQNDMGTFLDEFLFYLVPITTEKIAGQDIRGLIKSQIGGSGSSEETTTNTQNTIAQIFKSYTYSGGTHTIVIGLAELAGSSALSDLTLTLTGANDDDDNILDNYLSSLSVNTSIAGIITVDLNATLRNVSVAADNTGISSKGLAPNNIAITGDTFTHNKKSYMLDYYNYEPDTLYTLDGTVYAADNELYTEYGKLVEVYNLSDSTDAYSYQSTKGITLTCDFDKPSDKGYKSGDLEYLYKYVCRINECYRLFEKQEYKYYVGTRSDGSKYVYRLNGETQIQVAVKSIIGNALAQVTRDAKGKITAVTNREGGIQWSRPWQAAYEEAQATA